MFLRLNMRKGMNNSEGVTKVVYLFISSTFSKTQNRMQSSLEALDPTIADKEIDGWLRVLDVQRR